MVQYSGRYQAINNENDNTIEFRLFRGTLKYNTFVATLQLVKFICEYVNTNDIKNCRRLNLSQCDFSNYPELVTYIAERDLPTIELENIPEYPYRTTEDIMLERAKLLEEFRQRQEEEQRRFIERLGRSMEFTSYGGRIFADTDINIENLPF